MRQFIVFLFLLIFIGDLQAGGPWTKKKGEGFAQFAFYAIPSINRLSINAYKTKFLNRSIFDATGELFVEYGLAKRLTLSASLPLKIVSAGDDLKGIDSSQMGNGSIGTPGKILDAGLLVDLGNVRLAGKYNFLSKKVHMAAHLAIMAPTAIQAYNPNTALRTAYPCWGFQPAVSIGYSKEKIYTYLETGMNFRTHGYSHQWVANFEFGWRIGKRTYLALALDAFLCLPGGEQTSLEQWKRFKQDSMLIIKILLP